VREAPPSSLGGAGLTSEATVISHPVTGERAGTVLSMAPPAGTAVTPGTEAELVVGTGGEPLAPRRRRTTRSTGF
jgi:beta-lactam-binding protein with PASTA domain